MRIGDVSKELGIGCGTLRRWEKLGLIPKPNRTVFGLRQYSEDDLKQIREYLRKR